MELSMAPTPSWLCQAELLDRLGKKGSRRRSTDILAAAGLQTVFLTEFYTVSLQTVNCVINSLTPTAPNPNLFFFLGYTIRWKENHLSSRSSFKPSRQSSDKLCQ